MFIRIIASIALTSMWLSCSPKYVTPATTDSRNEAQANVKFASFFFKNANQTVSPEENLLVSPYSAGVALSMLEEGAEGQTKAEFDNVLSGRLYAAENLGGGDDLTVKSANSLWISSNFSVRNRYVNLLQKDYDAFVDTPDFSDPSTVKEINNWCSEHTSGKIPHILDELSPNDVMVLINALYFNAPWAEAFNEKSTTDATFHGVNGDKTVKMMYRCGAYEYGEYQGSQMIRLPYQGNRYSMVIVLPENMNDILSQFDASSFEAAVSGLRMQDVALRMPKFRLETSLILDKTLQNMGLKTAYSAAADFSGMSESGPLALGTVKQKCYIDVAEKGTEAAAVTIAQVRLTAMPRNVRMTVDRPFLFFITDSQTNNILFVGKVVTL